MKTLSRLQMRNVLGGEDGGGDGTFCGNVYTSKNCPAGTTAEKCDAVGSGYEARCRENATGYCYAYGTATCDTGAPE